MVKRTYTLTIEIDEFVDKAVEMLKEDFADMYFETAQADEKPDVDLIVKCVEDSCRTWIENDPGEMEQYIMEHMLEDYINRQAAKQAKEPADD